MEKITNIDELNLAIAALKVKQSAEGVKLKEQLILIQNNLSPVSLVKNSIMDLLSLSGLKNGLIDVTMGVTAGYITNKVFKGKSQNIFQKLLSIAAASLVSTEVSSHGGFLRSLVDGFFQKSTSTKPGE